MDTRKCDGSAARETQIRPRKCPTLRWSLGREYFNTNGCEVAFDRPTAITARDDSSDTGVSIPVEAGGCVKTKRAQKEYLLIA